MEMVETNFILENQTSHVIVGKCDNGPLSFTFQNNTDPGMFEDYSKMVN